jgi:hypothetical protein
MIIERTIKQAHDKKKETYKVNNMEESTRRKRERSRERSRERKC